MLRTGRALCLPDAQDSVDALLPFVPLPSTCFFCPGGLVMAGFGAKISLTATIKNTIKDYPEET